MIRILNHLLVQAGGSPGKDRLPQGRNEHRGRARHHALLPLPLPPRLRLFVRTYTLYSRVECGIFF